MINKRNIIALGLLLLIVIGFTSCEVDSQEFEYDQVNEVTIVTDTINFEIIQFETLEIIPLISETINDNRSYSYKWLAYPTISTSIEDVVVLGEEKNLNAAIGLDVNTYTLQYNVTDIKTGIVYTTRYSLRVNSGFYEGWLVTSNKAGKGKLSFIRIDGFVIDNPIEEINGKTYSGLAFDVASPIDSYSELQQVYYFSENGVYIFDANSFAEVGDSNSLFSSNITSNQKASIGVGAFGFNVYIVNNGKIHTSSLFYGFDGSYSPPLSGNYDLVYPYVFTNQSFNAHFGNTYFYDNGNKRFIRIGYNSPTVAIATGTPTSPYFDMANTNKTMIAATKGVGITFHALMKDDDTNAFYIYSMAGGLPTGKKEISLAGLDNVRGFDAISSGGNLLYFGIGNKLYRYDNSANTVDEIFTFLGGAQIADVKVYKNPYVYFSLSPTDPLHNKRIAVAVNNGENGEVFYFNLTGTGFIENSTFTEHYTGFDTISTLSYRNR